MGAQQELLVVIEQVKPALEVGKEHGDSLDPLLIGQILEPFFANFIGSDPVGAIALGLQVERFQFFVGESEKIAVISRHGSPLSRRNKVQSRRTGRWRLFGGFLKIG